MSTNTFLRLAEVVKNQKKKEAAEDLKWDLYYRKNTQSRLDKAAGILGMPFHLLNNIAYNVSKGEELPDVPLFSSYAALSDTVEAINPLLRKDREWNQYKPAVNLVSSIALDPTTYMGFGAFTKAGKAAQLGKAAGVVSKVDKAGKVRHFTTVLRGSQKGKKVITSLDELADLSRIAGKKIDKAIEITEATNPKLYKKLNKLGYGNKAIPKLPEKMSDQIEQGYRSVVGFSANPFDEIKGGVPLKGLQSKTARKVEDFYRGVITDPGKVGSFVRGKGIISPEKYLKAMGQDHIARVAQDFGKVNEAEIKKIFKQGVSDAKEIKQSVQAARLGEARKLGMNVDDYITKIGGVDEATGLTKAETDDFVRLFHHGLPEEGTFKGSRFVFTPDEIVRNTDEVADFSKNYIEGPWKAVTDKILDMRNQRIKTTAMLQGFVDDAGVAVYLAKNYTPQIDMAANGAKLYDKVSSTLGSILKTVSGKGRIWKGVDPIDAERYRNIVMHVTTSKEFTQAEKIAMHLVKDSRLGGTLDEIYKVGKSVDIDKRIAQARKAGDDSLFEVLVSARKTAQDFDKVSSSPKLVGAADELGISTKEMKELILDTNINDVAERAKDITMKDFYLKNLPVVNAFGQVEAAKRAKAFRAFNEIFTNSLENGGKGDGIVKVVGAADELGEGYVKLNKNMMTRIDPNALDELVAKGVLDKEFLEVAKRTDLVYAMRKDIYDVMQNTKLFNAMLKPETIMTESFLKDIGKFVDGLNKFWRTTTLFPFPAFYVRNVIDEGLKYVIEFGPQRFKKDTIAASKAVKALGKNKAVDDVIVSMGGKVQKADDILDDVLVTTILGESLTTEDILKIADDYNLLGYNIGKYGDLSDDIPTRWMEILDEAGDVPAHVKENMVKTINTATPRNMGKMEAASQAVMNNKIVRSMMEKGEYMDQMSRLRMLIGNLRKYPLEEAISRTRIVNFDWNSVSKFEKDTIGRFLAFYSFRKAVTKYIADSLRRQPWKFIKIIPMGLNLVEESVSAYGEDDRLNRGYLPDYLKGSSIDFGKFGDRNTVLNMSGFASFAEMQWLSNPGQLFNQSIYPIFKYIGEIIANRDLFTGRDIENEDGEYDVYFGLPVGKRFMFELPGGVKVPNVMRFFEDYRPYAFLREFTETALQDTPVSIFGTKEKRGMFGLIKTGKYNPRGYGEFALKTFGLPVAQVDSEVSKLYYNLNLRRKVQDYKRVSRFNKRRYKNDPKYLRAIETSRYKNITKDIYADKAIKYKGNHPYSSENRRF
jgi:hypothetical protein